MCRKEPLGIHMSNAESSTHSHLCSGTYGTGMTHNRTTRLQFKHSMTSVLPVMGQATEASTRCTSSTLGILIVTRNLAANARLKHEICRERDALPQSICLVSLIGRHQKHLYRKYCLDAKL
nr:hypothetical protein CFP56_23838 [Quercus suber]